MKSVEYIGIHSDRRSSLDEFILDTMKGFLTRTAMIMRSNDEIVTRITLAEKLNTDRQRISRICKTLEITNIFDAPRKKVKES